MLELAQRISKMLNHDMNLIEYNSYTPYFNGVGYCISEHSICVYIHDGKLHLATIRIGFYYDIHIISVYINTTNYKSDMKEKIQKPIYLILECIEQHTGKTVDKDKLIKEIVE